MKENRHRKCEAKWCLTEQKCLQPATWGGGAWRRQVGGQAGIKMDRRAPVSRGGQEHVTQVGPGPCFLFSAFVGTLLWVLLLLSSWNCRHFFFCLRCNWCVTLVLSVQHNDLIIAYLAKRSPGGLVNICHLTWSFFLWWVTLKIYSLFTYNTVLLTVVTMLRISSLFPSPGDLPNPGIEPMSPSLQADSLPVEPQEYWSG